MTAMGVTQGAATRDVSRSRVQSRDYQTVPAHPGPRLPPSSRTTRRRPSSWRREAARTVPPDRSGLLSRSVIRHFHRVWPLETLLTLFLPDSVASAVEPEDSAVRELVRDLRTRVIACRALSHPRSSCPCRCSPSATLAGPVPS